MPNSRTVWLMANLAFLPAPSSQALARPPDGEVGKPLGWSQENRTVVTFKIADEVAQKLLPAGWTVVPLPQGPAKGTNLAIVFTERVAALDASGEIVGGEEAAVFLSIPSRKGQETAFMIIDGYSDLQTAPGFYRANKPATVALERTTRTTNLTGTVEETWTVASGGGERMMFHVAYERNAPVRTQSASRNVSAVDATLRQTYQLDQGTSAILSAPSKVNRGKDLSFEASGGALGAIFDGKPEMVSVLSLPWYVRQTFQPTGTD